MKRVAVIGSGIAGLPSAKYAIENGISPVIFDKAKIPGGQWAVDSKNKTNIWNNMYSNVSLYSGGYSDELVPKSVSFFPEKTDIHNFLMNYIKKNQLDKYLRLETRIDKATYLEDKRWKIESFDLKTNEKKSEVFDHLLVATGTFSNPRIPNFENQENYKGLIMHSSDFELNDKKLKSKKVLVVGCSYSGADISANLVDHASSVTNIFRRPYIVTRRFIRFKSNELRDKKNLFHILPNEFLANSRGFKPGKHLSKEEKIIEFRRKISLLNTEQTNKEKSHPELYFDLNKDTPRISISDNYYGFVKQGKITPKKGFIKRFEENGVLLNDGSFIEADAVLFCTGYNTSTSFFDESTKKILGVEDRDDYRFPYILYNNTLRPEIENMAMISQIEGFFITAAELQAKWINKIFSGKLKLPSNEVMFKEIDKLKKKRDLNLQTPFPYGSVVDLIDSMANKTEVQHDFEKLKTENPTLFRKLWNNLSIACQYRLDLVDSMKTIDEIDYLTNKVYEFNDDNEDEEASIHEIAKIFQTNNPEYNVPMKIFRT